MERNDGKKLKVTAALVAAGVIGLTVQARGARHTMSVDGAERALVYGQVDGNWVRGASRLVQSHPELAGRLAQISESASIDGVRRGLALDALAAAGSDAAQTAMREVLATPSVKADPIYPMLLMRLGSVTSPACETLTFLHVTRESAEADGQEQLAYAAEHTLARAQSNRLSSLPHHNSRQARAAANLHGHGE